LCQSGLPAANHFRLSGYKSSNTKKLSASQSRDRVFGDAPHSTLTIALLAYCRRRVITLLLGSSHLIKNSARLCEAAAACEQ
jgi:hypothetical protein